ncbi:hypothetical protein Tsubulata_016944 [Turnera subulata]|uniref:DUF506 domain-containing protein n=1 Tax=Turnera subulata TaxID=218843 RepID=A0A9Q0J7T7_9ROSI|nr:hypothetical protein Tsubulata_016944 [Turnera subulata]
MANTGGQVRFKRVAAAILKEAARARVCESSSGSDHYGSVDNNSEDDLSDLVNSFMEREYQNQLLLGGGGELQQQIKDKEDDQYYDDDDHHHHSRSSVSIDMLENLFDSKEDLQEEVNNIQRACDQIIAAEQATSSSSPSKSHALIINKRTLMSGLRDRGFDAGLCKSRWQKFGRYQSGQYEYVDVNVDGNRYIVEVSLAAEFEIARPTKRYTELLQVFPRVFIGKPEKLKEIARLMCSGIRESMKSIGMHVPPWRRNGYMQVKWFGDYKRTTQHIPTKSYNSAAAQTSKVAIGFQALPLRPYKYCREDHMISKVGGSRVGYLTAAFHVSGAIDM